MELLLVAQSKDNPRAYTGTYTPDALMALAESHLPVCKVYVHEEDPQKGAFFLRHVGHLAVAFCPLQHAPLPQGEELNRQVAQAYAIHAQPEEKAPLDIPEETPQGGQRLRDSKLPQKEISPSTGKNETEGPELNLSNLSFEDESVSKPSKKKASKATPRKAKPKRASRKAG